MGLEEDQVYRREPRTVHELEDATHDFISNIPVECCYRRGTTGLTKSHRNWRWLLCGSVITNRQYDSHLMLTNNLCNLIIHVCLLCLFIIIKLYKFIIIHRRVLNFLHFAFCCILLRFVAVFIIRSFCAIFHFDHFYYK